MIIPGYLDGYQPPVDPAVLTDATAWLDLPATWPALLWALGGARAAIDAFDVDPADVDMMLTQLSDPDHWPVFTVGVATGHRVHLVWRNFHDESGWY